MSLFVPVISPEIFALRPDFHALSIHVSSIDNQDQSELSDAALAAASKSPCDAAWAEAHREAWREAYRAFGAKPQRTLCSAEALLKRVQRDGALPGINAVVDIYNAISLKYAIPVGGENVDAYMGMPHLVRSAGDEKFETAQAGAAVIEHPDKGEVIWRDEAGVTCRRWNWRQGSRTRIETSTRNMWFVLEALGPMPDDALKAAGKELAQSLLALSPDCEISATLLHASGAENYDFT